MSTDMKYFFHDLLSLKDDEWKPFLSVLTIERKPSAAVFTFENSDTILGYNSGYDPSRNYYSAGLLVHVYGIRRAIEEKKKTYDFLRGQERYKFDLGAKPAKLYKIIHPL